LHSDYVPKKFTSCENVTMNISQNVYLENFFYTKAINLKVNCHGSNLLGPTWVFVTRLGLFDQDETVCCLHSDAWQLIKSSTWISSC